MNIAILTTLIKKEFALELKNKVAVGSLVLYVISSLFVAYLSFRKIVDVKTFNALFWVIILFASIQVSSRAFDKESAGRYFTLYTLASAQEIISAKIIFNFLFLAFTGLLTTLFYVLFMGQSVVEEANLGMFLLVVLLCSGGLSMFLTLITGIAFKTGNNVGLTSILGFPIILPFLLAVLRFSKNALLGLPWAVNSQYLILIGLLCVLGALLSYILFPYLWRD